MLWRLGVPRIHLKLKNKLTRVLVDETYEDVLLNLEDIDTRYKTCRIELKPSGSLINAFYCEVNQKTWEVMEFDIPSRYEFGWMQARFTELLSIITLVKDFHFLFLACIKFVYIYNVISRTKFFSIK